MGCEHLGWVDAGEGDGVEGVFGKVLVGASLKKQHDRDIDRGQRGPRVLRTRAARGAATSRCERRGTQMVMRGGWSSLAEASTRLEGGHKAGVAAAGEVRAQLEWRSEWRSEWR
jgi:hypothetical protein